jgi:hypothetical protein
MQRIVAGSSLIYERWPIGRLTRRDAFPLVHSIKARPRGHVIGDGIRDGTPSPIPCCVSLFSNRLVGFASLPGSDQPAMRPGAHPFGIGMKI